jgi:hypothetical protein
MLNKARHEKNSIVDFKFDLPCRGDIFRNTGSFMSFTTLKIYIVREDFKSKKLLFTERKQQYGKRAMQQKVCFGETVRVF